MLVGFGVGLGFWPGTVKGGFHKSIFSRHFESICCCTGTLSCGRCPRPCHHMFPRGRRCSHLGSFDCSSAPRKSERTFTRTHSLALGVIRTLHLPFIFQLNYYKFNSIFEIQFI